MQVHVSSDCNYGNNSLRSFYSLNLAPYSPLTHSLRSLAHSTHSLVFGGTRPKTQFRDPLLLFVRWCSLRSQRSPSAHSSSLKGSRRLEFISVIAISIILPKNNPTQKHLTSPHSQSIPKTTEKVNCHSRTLA